MLGECFHALLHQVRIKKSGSKFSNQSFSL